MAAEQPARAGDDVLIRATFLRVRLGRAEVQLEGGEFAAIPLEAMSVPSVRIPT